MSYLDDLYSLDGKVAVDDFSGGYRMTASRVMSLGEAKMRFARGVHISMSGPADDIFTRLEYVFAPYRDGSDPVWLDYRNERATAQLELGPDWCVNACDELIAALSEMDIVSEARLIY